MNPELLAAKLRAPAPAGALERVRLFERLDSLRATGAAIWIEGPAGAGKSTLAATYAQARAAAVAWYRLDRADADPAGFFHHLALAVQPLLSTADRLPALGSESLGGMAAFGRTFFGELGAAVRPGAHLVFDNVEALPPGSPVEWLLAMLVEEPALRRGVFFAGRSSPWNALAPLFGDGRIARLDSSSLHFDLSEVQQLASVDGRVPDEEQVRTVMAATGGWPVAVALLLRNARRRSNDEAAAPDETLFDRLAREVLDALPRTSHDLLTTLSVAETLSPALMIELTGNEDAPRLVAQLADSAFPISATADASRQFRVHELLRAYLLREARRMGDDAVNRLRVRAAVVHEREQRLGEAALVLTDAQDWGALAALAGRQAPALLAQGRNQELLSWLDALPPEQRQVCGWTPYWRGQALLAIDPLAARQAFEAAHACFVANADNGGRALAAVGVLSAVYFMWDDFHPALPWIDELARLIPDVTALADPMFAAQVLAAANCIHYAAPDHALLPAIAALGERLLPQLPPPAQAPVAIFLLEYHIYRGDLARVAALLAALRESLAEGQAAPLLRLGMHIFAAVHAFLTAEHDSCYREVAAGMKLGDVFGVSLVAQILRGQEVYASLSVGDLARASRALDAMSSALSVSRRIDLAMFHHLRSGALLLAGNLEAARQSAEYALETAQRCAALAPALLCRSALAQILVRTGECDRALVLLDEVDDLCARMGARLIGFISGLTRCNALLEMGRSDSALAVLAATLEVGRRHDYVNAHPFWQPAWMARLVNIALEHRVEPEYARRLVRRRQLPAPRGAGPAWPWSVRVRCLGAFRIEVDGAPSGLDSRRQQKPLLLLQALVALNPDGASKSALADAVWPDTEGDAAMHALEVNLQRLRLHLHHPDALRLQAGAVRLDRELCWVDVWSLDAAVGGIDGGIGDGTTPGAAALTRQLLAAYRGPFLPGLGAPWASAARSRHAARFVRAVSKAGAELERSGESDLAIESYERALEAEPHAEELLRRLMQALAARGQHAEALWAYQRFADTLRDRLGLSPHESTRRIAAGLREHRTSSPTT